MAAIWFISCFALLFIVIYFSRKTNEGFGMSPGTMDQLSSTRAPGPIHPVQRIDVNRRPDQDLDDQIQLNLEKKGLKDMTESPFYQSNYAPA